MYLYLACVYKKGVQGKVKYIHFLIRIQNTLHRGICFSAAKHVQIYIFRYVQIVQNYLINQHHLHQIYLDSSLSRYLLEVSSVKLSKDKKRKYFNFEI